MYPFLLILSLIPAFVSVPATPALTTTTAPVSRVAQAETNPPPNYAPTPITPAPSHTTTTPASMAVTSSDAPVLKGPSALLLLAYGGYGVGGRFAFPIHGSILRSPTMRDGFAIEVGADYVRWSESLGGYGKYSWSVLRVAGGVMWDIWVTDHLAFYPKIELGYNRYSYNYGGFTGSLRSDSPVFFNGAGGVMYRLQSGLTARAELGYMGLAVGAGWLF